MIDRYFLGLPLGTLGSVVGIIMSLMVLEHIPHLIEITRLSGKRGFIVRETVLGPPPEYGGISFVSKSTSPANSAREFVKPHACAISA